VHGLLGTAYAHFGAQITAWSDDHRVVPVDLPGHGRCRVDAGPSYLDTALDYLAAVVGRFGAGRLVAASYLGGPLAVRLALARPELVTSLVLTGFVPGLPRDVFAGWLAGFQTLADRNAELAAGYDRLHGPRWRTTLTEFQADVDRAYEERALIRPEQLGTLDVDVLIVNGSVKSAERAAARHAGDNGHRVRGLVLAGAGHIAAHDAPDEFTQAVTAFWRERAAA
jgi:pimeloyl-ACP methyl ester carboxylesterase